jgi:hypothetical protein
MTAQTWPTRRDYLRIRGRVAATQEGRKLIQRTQKVRRPTSADDFASRLIYVVIASGFSAQTASTINEKVKAALPSGEPVWPDAFGNRLKAEGIEQL